MKNAQPKGNVEKSEMMKNAVKKTVEIDTSTFLPKLIIKHKLPMTQNRLNDLRGTMEEIVKNGIYDGESRQSNLEVG